MPGEWKCTDRSKPIRLECDHAWLRELARAHGTPLVILDLSRVRENLVRITNALMCHLGTTATPMFAVKSCYVTELLETIGSEGWGVEVMSAFELAVVRAAGVPGRAITLTGLGWGAGLCRDALATGVRRFVVDSDADFAAIAAAAASTQVADVFVRLNVADRVRGTFLEAEGKLGQLAGPRLAAMFRAIADHPGLRIGGLHMHQFNRLTDVGLFEKSIGALADVVRGLRSEGIEIPSVDIGGGLESITRLDSAGAPVEEFAAAVARQLGPLGLERVLTEFGRAVVGDAGVALGRVTAVKRSGTRCWVVVDIPTNTLVPVPGATFTPMLIESRDGRREELCSFTDGTGSPVAFARDVLMPAPGVGELVCLAEAGAYTTVFMELWAADLPSLILIGSDGAAKIRIGKDMTRRTFESWYGPGAWTRLGRFGSRRTATKDG
jgi:diaminopimelate decarboxylase